MSISQYVYNYRYSSFTPCKGIIQHSLGFWIPRCGFRIPGTGFQYFSVKNVEFWISIVIGIPDSLICIPGSKTEDSGFWIPRTGFQYFSVKNEEFWIPIVIGIPDSLIFNPDSKTQDSGFHKQNFLGFRIPQQGLKFKFEFGSTCATRYKFLGVLPKF